MRAGFSRGVTWDNGTVDIMSTKAFPSPSRPPNLPKPLASRAQRCRTRDLCPRCRNRHRARMPACSRNRPPKSPPSRRKTSPTSSSSSRRATPTSPPPALSRSRAPSSPSPPNRFSSTLVTRRKAFFRALLSGTMLRALSPAIRSTSRSKAATKRAITTSRFSRWLAAPRLVRA